MDKLVTIRLELTCRDIAGKLYTTVMNYCSPNQYTTLISVMSELQFAMDVEKARKMQVFRMVVILLVFVILIRNQNNFNILGR